MSDDLNVLMPEQSLVIGGRTVTVRELTFAQTIALGSKLAPLLDSLSGFIGNESINPLMAVKTLGEHYELTLELLQLSTGLSLDELKGLGASKSHALMSVFFAVHLDFFAQRLIIAALDPISVAPVGQPSSPN